MSRRALTIRRATGAALLLPIGLLIGVLLPAGPAAAHPLDAYLQAAYLTPAPTTIGVDLDISPGVLVAPDALADLDADDNRQISEAESHAYGERVLGRLQLRADDLPLRIVLTDVDMPSYLIIQAGYGVVRLHARADGAPSTGGEHELFFRNDNAPKGATYQVNAVSGARAPVVLGAQQRDAVQQQSRVTYRIGPGAPAAPSDAAGAAPPAEAGRLAGLLESPTLSLTVVLLAVGVAALLGALHALTPGHAKTLMAAYLVGSGGTTRNAVALGAVITFTHTASVIVIGLVALVASQFLLPGVLVPALETVSGLLVLVIGLQLVRRRRPAARTRPPVHEHHSDHAQVHAGVALGHSRDHHHEARGVPHSHGGRLHTHTLPAGGITPRNLIAMGVSGGLVPCPEALGVMVLAVGVNRTVLGLSLILSFSIGLAAVLMGFGIILVRSRHLLSRFERLGTRWRTILPLASAAVVIALGAGLLLSGLSSGFPLPS
jgi:nickel/cobalt transporter (NicO) family protein